MIMSTEMANHNIVVCQAKDDGDTKTTMDLVTSVNTPVIVVAQDTDVLVFLCYHRPTVLICTYNQMLMVFMTSLL